MLYKFDILFKKELRGGGVKVVTYRQLLQDADAFGQGVTLAGAVGTLSLTDSERESGYSISSLFVKYRTQLVGYYWAEVFGKEFPLQFSFNQTDDAASIRAELVEVKPDAVLVLGDTNSCQSVIGAKRLHIPIFHMETGNRCKDECLPEENNRRIVDIISDVNMAYSEHARRYLADTGLPKERTYVTGSPMAEVLHNNLKEIEASDIHQRLAA